MQLAKSYLLHAATYHPYTIYSMTKSLLACGLALCFASVALAAAPDSSVIISSAQNNYRFVYNTGKQQIEVKKEEIADYTSSAYQVNVPIAELYNNRVSINEVSCKVNGHTPKGFSPKTTYYEVNDVFFSDEQLCYFPMLLDKKGSTGTVTFDETITDPRYFTTIAFASPYAVKHRVVSLKVPRWMHIEIRDLNFGSADIKKTTQYISAEDADLITYTAENIPAMKDEDNSPGPTYLYPHLLVMCKSASVSGQNFTYFNTLADQYAWYHSLTRNLVQNADAIKTRALEITRGLTADSDKIKAVYYWVQGNIRYIAFEDGMAGFVPDRADEVMRKKYGDCKAMATLTKSLLVALGYDARLCWLGTHHLAYNYQTPSLVVDNHMICALYYKSAVHYLDATESYLGMNEYAERIQGRQVLIENGDTFTLANIPASALSQNYSYSNYKLSLNGEQLTGNVICLWKGEDKEDILSGLNSVKQEKAEEAMMSYLSGHNSSYEIKSLVLPEHNNPDKDLRVTYHVENKKAVSLFDKALYVDLNMKRDMADAAIPAGRLHDYWFEHKLNICNETELVLPADYKITYLPKSLDIVNADYEFHVQYSSVQPGKLIYKKTIIVKNTHLAKACFARWNKDIEQLINTYNETVILKPNT